MKTYTLKKDYVVMKTHYTLRDTYQKAKKIVSTFERVARDKDEYKGVQIEFGFDCMIKFMWLIQKAPQHAGWLSIMARRNISRFGLRGIPDQYDEVNF